MTTRLAEPRFIVEAESGAVSGRCSKETAEEIRDSWESRGIESGIEPVARGVPE